MFKLVVLSVVLASAVAKPSGLWGGPLAAGWGAPLAAGWGAPLAAPWAAPVAAPWAAAVAAPLAAHVAAPVAAAPLAPVGAYNYRGPLSLAPGQPANILANDGRPLDTLSVNVDKAIHYTARALDHGARGAHIIGKRSIVGAPWAGAGHWGAPAVARNWGAPAVAWSHTARIDVPAARVLAPAHVGIAAAPALGWGRGHW